MPRTHDSAYNRDEEQRPDAPRAKTEPNGSEGSAKSAKTLTDPASGAGRRRSHAPSQAQTDQVEGADRKA